MQRYTDSRTVAIAILNRTIADGDTFIPEGSTVFVTRLTQNRDGSDAYACVASVAINCDGVVSSWRILAPLDAVTVKSTMNLREIALNYGSKCAAACDDEATSG